MTLHNLKDEMDEQRKKDDVALFISEGVGP